MNIEAHIMVYNESETIHLTIKHYQQFCSKIIIHDNFSDDRTREVAEEMGCEVQLFGIKGQLSDAEYTRLKNNCWKGSNADWVIVCDADEILYVTELSGTILLTFGWNVFSENVPRETWSEIQTGFHDPQYSKLICFKPEAIKEINYVHGCHVAKPTGSVIYSDTVTPLFHYRNVGGSGRLIKRHALYRDRLSDWNKRWGCGSHYNYSDERRKLEWEEQYQKSVEFSLDFTLQSQIQTQK